MLAFEKTNQQGKEDRKEKIGAPGNVSNAVMGQDVAVEAEQQTENRKGQEREIEFAAKPEQAEKAQAVVEEQVEKNKCFERQEEQ